MQRDGWTKTLRIGSTVLFATLLATGTTACRDDDGPAERAGREADEAIEELERSSEQRMERLGRELDEAAEETEEAGREIEEAVEDAAR